MIRGEHIVPSSDSLPIFTHTTKVREARALLRLLPALACPPLVALQRDPQRSASQITQLFVGGRWFLLPVHSLLSLTFGKHERSVHSHDY